MLHFHCQGFLKDNFYAMEVYFLAHPQSVLGLATSSIVSFIKKKERSLDGYLLTLLPFSIYFARLKKYSCVCFISGRTTPDSHLVATFTASEEVEMDAVEKEKL